MTTAAVGEKSTEISPLGPDGVLLCFAKASSPEVTDQVLGFAETLRAATLPGVTEIATALTSVLVKFDPDCISRAALTDLLLAGVTEAQALRDLTQTELRVLAIGFAPGQPYIGRLPEAWEIPRQPQLTPSVPAGALVVALRQLVLFGNVSTTGWRQIGLCAFRPFKIDRAHPFALRQGDAIRLVAAPLDEIRALGRNPDALGGARCEVLT